MRQLLRSIVLVSLSTMGITGVSILRNKLLAVMLGPGGVGLVAQILGLQMFAVGVVPLGMQTGALRYIARYRAQDPELLARFVATSARLFMWLSLAGTALCLVFLRPITAWAMESTVYAVLVIPPLLGIPFLVQTQMWLTFVQAGLDIKSYSRALIITSILGFIVLVPLVLVWRLKGASIHLFLFAVFGYFVARWHANRAMTPELRRQIASARFDWSSTRDLSRFGLANLLPFALTLGFPFVIRAQIVHDMGLTANGIYQALFAISTQYLAVPLNAMTTYSFPRISQLTDLDEINKEVNNAIHLALLFTVVGVLGILLTRDLAIRILFSDKFMAAAVLFPVQMVGDVIKAVSFGIQLPLLPQERYRARNVMAVIQYAVFAAVFFMVPARDRLQGAIWAHTVSWAVHLAIHYVYLRRVNGFRFTRENLKLLTTSLVAVCAVAAMPFPDLRWRFAGAGVTLLWIVLSVRREDVMIAYADMRAKVDARIAAGRERT